MKTAWVIALALSAITAAPALARPSTQPPGGGLTVLDIPYVPQSEALCGGAAAAMVLRYWGARDVVAEDFAPLLDRDKGGIRVDRLAEGVRARGWNAVALSGTGAIAREQVARRRPVIALVSVGTNRYHYVVIAAWSDRGVIAHDPARAPDRVYSIEEFERAWAKGEHWMLVITPAAAAGRKGPALQAADAAAGPKESAIRAADAPTVAEPTPGGVGRVLLDAASHCDRLVSMAIADGSSKSAERFLTQAIGECPQSAAARRELAGYRLTHGAPGDAVALARDAVALDPGDAHAWYLLGAARYLTHDPPGALDAWNHIGEPHLDLVSVEGLSHSSYGSVAQTIGVPHGAMITARALARAERRIADLPAVAASRVELEPRGQGLAQIDVGIVERSTLPRSKTELLAQGARAAIDREVGETFANLNDSGDAWSASWRWWANRPRIAFAAAAPGLLGTRAVWRVETSWEVQSYQTGAAILRSERTRGALGASDWITPSWKWRATSGIDRWSDRGAFWFGSGVVDRRTTDNRAEASVDATAWIGATRFAQVGSRASWTSRVAPRGWRALTAAGAALATASAPADVWAGAGVGHARDPLLRAHPLLDDGVITGPAFGRAIQYATALVERWPSVMNLWGVGVAAFVDVASVQHRLSRTDAATPNAWFADAGGGLRVRAAWLPGIVRIDYAHGLRDRANAVSVGWQLK